MQNGFVQSAGKALKSTGSWLGWVAVGAKCWMGCNTLRWVWVGLVLDALLSKLGVGCCLVWPEMHWALQHWAALGTVCCLVLALPPHSSPSYSKAKPNTE